jgi:predicted MFS family arabinose efflux permease
MILAVGVTAGQLLGGVIVTVDIFGSSWRPAFLVNVPIGLLLLLCAGSVLPESRGEKRRRLDVAGVLTLSASMLLVVVPLTFGREVDWATWTWLSLGLGVVGLVGFVVLERAVLRRGGSPLLDLAVFVPGVRAGLLVVSIGFVGYGGFLFAMALYLQSGLGFSPIESGLVFVAYSIGFGTANLSWARLPAPLLRWTPTVALGAMAAAVAVFGLVAVRSGWTPAAMLPLLLVAGSGHGFAFGPVVNRMAARVQPAQGPALSGLVASATQLSIVLGVATLGTVYLAKAEVGSAAPSSDAIGLVAFAIATAVVVAIACSIQLSRRR